MTINEKMLTQETSDFNVCSVLMYFGNHLININRTDPRRCIFILSRSEYSDTIVEQFFNGKLLVDPRQFIVIQKDLKSRIYVSNETNHSMRS
jgi:hypothetical protein